MPEDDFEGPVSNFISGDIRKFPAGEQDVKFLNSEGPILVRLKFLDGLYTLIDIFLPGDDIIDNSLNLINIVGLVVNFSKRFDIILSLLNKKSIPTFGVIFKFIDSFINFFFKFFTDSLDKLVKFDKIIIFS